MDDGREGWGQKERGWQGVSLASCFRQSRLHSRKGDPCDQQRGKRRPKVLKVAERNNRVHPIMLEKGDEKEEQGPQLSSWPGVQAIINAWTCLYLSDSLYRHCWPDLKLPAGWELEPTLLSPHLGVLSQPESAVFKFQNSRESLGLEKKWLRKSVYSWLLCGPQVIHVSLGASSAIHNGASPWLQLSSELSKWLPIKWLTALMAAQRIWAASPPPEMCRALADAAPNEQPIQRERQLLKFHLPKEQQRFLALVLRWGLTM